MEKKLKEGDTPLFDMSNKDLIGFAYRTRNMNVSDTVNSEMMRRLNVSIKNFNNSSSKQTRWIIRLTIAMLIVGIAQMGLFM
ncbi:MAG: hypothetical protein ABIE36_01390 [Candidatus Diapherotrites archaeon]